ncbi:breast carcinoma-amplified sequence 4 isoform X2 [Grus americana]|nr:breast carcinoma-amplified sequence 4 isoform X2 [Grus americana]
MVTHHVSFPEEQVLEAGKSHGTFLKTVCKLFQCAAISSFKNRHPLSAACSRDLPKLYRTEDFFPMNYLQVSAMNSASKQELLQARANTHRNKASVSACSATEPSSSLSHLHFRKVQNGRNVEVPDKEPSFWKRGGGASNKKALMVQCLLHKESHPRREELHFWSLIFP